ncbi:MAG: hypothetical protein ACXABY_17155 [Candidatus Thorarchaeota archaeon]|jgi:hypothetical protein
MIYDFQDISTKYYLASSVRDWVKVGNNAMYILNNPRVKEITEADLSPNSDDDIVWTVLYLIGVRLLRYVTTGKEFGIALNLNWRKPAWLNERECSRMLNRHIDWMMEIEQEGRSMGVEPTALIPSLEMQKYGKTCMLPPKEPVRDNLQHEKRIIARNKKLLARKRAIHKRRTR